MKDLKQAIVTFLRDEEGLETVEYAVAGSLIVAGSVLAFTNLGQQVALGINALAAAIVPIP
ncbi:MAG: pilus assembly protein [Motiliproteus sp.]